MQTRRCGVPPPQVGTAAPVLSTAAVYEGRH